MCSEQSKSGMIQIGMAQASIFYPLQLDRVVVRLHVFGAGVASLIPTQYPVGVLARPLILTKKPWNGAALSAACPQHRHGSFHYTLYCIV